MPLTPHPECERIARGIRRCLALAVPWAGVIFRATGMEYANQRDVVTGEGSRVAGARFTPRGAFRTVYGSLDLETALAEVLAHHRHEGIPEAEALPLTLVALQVEAQDVLDLTDGRIRRTLGIASKRITAEPWRALQHRGQEALTQAIGRLARDTGLQGLLVPAAAQLRGRNLVLFPDHLAPGQLAIIHGERLPARPRRKKS